MALRMPSARFVLRFVKKLTVTGIIEYTQGVNKASNPPPKAARKIHHSERPPTGEASDEPTTGATSKRNRSAPFRNSSPRLYMNRNSPFRTTLSADDILTS